MNTRHSFNRYSVLILFFISIGSCNSIYSKVYDVQHYDIKVDLYHSLIEEDAYFTGEVTTTILIDTTQTNRVVFDSFALLIDSVKNGPLNLIFSVVPNQLIVNLDRMYQQGEEELSIEIFYAHPDSLGSYFGGYTLALPDAYLSQKVAYTNGLPNYSHYWFPCKEDLSDRASLDLTAAVPAPDYSVVSNGKLIETYQLNDKIYYHWREENSVKPTIIFFSASEYTVMTHTFTRNDIPKVIQFYVWPVNGNFNFDSGVCFSRITELIEFYSDIYRDFPFDNMKIAFAQGIYSNQTVMSVDETALNFLTTYNDYRFFPHEMAHQWFGSFINAGSLRELWLNEGFAQYSMLLFREHKSGGNIIRSALTTAGQFVLEQDIALVNDSLYNPIIYLKGPCVIDMLRYCLGDSLYWASISNLLNNYAFQSFLSSDLLNVVSTTAGEDYSWFFDQWVYNAGYPIYEIRYTTDPLTYNDYQVNINVKQVQPLPGYFKIPLQFKLYSGLGDTTATLINNARDQDFSVRIHGEPDSVKFDEDNRITLKKVNLFTGNIVELQTLTPGFSLDQNYPNPFNPTTRISYEIGPASGGSLVTLKVYDVLGREVGSLVNEEKQPGKYTVAFDASKFSSGVYYYRLVSKNNVMVKKMILLK